ncbi:MAG: hypothetical protein NTW16_02975, partial [Bacteroidetes bacterium]|nr:hypothetical protein [Bacteroidota bacterium]
MRQLSVLTILLFLIIPVFSQELMDDSLLNSGQRFLQPKKFDYGVTLGSQFTSASGYGSALQTYVTPHFSYNLNKRLSIGGGISVIPTNYFKSRSYFQNEQAPGNNGNFTSGMVFVDGQYIVNKHLTVSGSAYKQFPVSQDPLPYNPFNPVSSRGAQGVNFNVAYKINDHMFIQAGFRYSDGTNPYYTDPFN